MPLETETEPVEALAVRPPVVDALILQRDPTDVLAEATRAANALMRVMEGKKHKVVFNDEQYIENEDWITIGHFYGVTAQLESDHYVQFGETEGWEATAILISRDGRTLGRSTAMCLNDEKTWRGKPLFQLRSMAQTRASSKVHASVLRFVPVLAGFKATSAEELDDVVTRVPTVPPAAAADIGPRTGKPASSARPPAGFYVIDQFEHDGKWFHVYLGNPPQHYKTQIVKIGALLRDAYTRRVPVALDVAANKKPGEAGYVNRVRYVDEAAELEAREATRIESDEPPA